mmetsp:Transcript_13179/g.39888  ORF Transcript_13179/g.39888 Transcript_13179/m.39888 type:complete len:696 (-) Transcript_13179:1737-3824(-)
MWLQGVPLHFKSALQCACHRPIDCRGGSLRYLSLRQHRWQLIERPAAFTMTPPPVTDRAFHASPASRLHFPQTSASTSCPDTASVRLERSHDAGRAEAMSQHSLGDETILAAKPNQLPRADRLQSGPAVVDGGQSGEIARFDGISLLELTTAGCSTPPLKPEANALIGKNNGGNQSPINWASTQRSVPGTRQPANSQAEALPSPAAVTIAGGVHFTQSSSCCGLDTSEQQRQQQQLLEKPTSEGLSTARLENDSAAGPDHRKLPHFQLMGDSAESPTASVPEDTPAAATVSCPVQRQLPDLERTLTSLEVPPRPGRLGPRVEHFLVPRDCSAVEALWEMLGLPGAFAAELLRFGAVHYSPIHPELPPYRTYETSESAAHSARVDAARSAGKARLGKDPRLTVPRRVMTDAPVTEGGYMRVHLHPKRFHAVYTTDWKARVLAEGKDYAVLNKPPAVQVTPTVDNMLESCLMLGAKAVGRQEALHITHRLDTCTEGVLILGKTTPFVKAFNSLMQSPGAISKMYRALAASPVSPGILVDDVVIKQRSAGVAPHTVVVPEGTPSSLRCELDVLSVTQVDLCGEARDRWGPTGFEHVIRLKTGRTHQIRVQLAHRGAALLGDAMYNPAAAAEAEPDSYSPGASAPADQGKRAVVAGIGLQAFRMEVHDPGCLMGAEDVIFEAPTPWWRTTELGTATLGN